MIKTWLAKRRARREADDFRRGYDYAAGCLLRSNGFDRPWPDDPHPWRSAFDDGILEAERDFAACFHFFKERAAG